MSFEQLISVRTPERTREYQAVRPTLVVGLGGTGKEILLRFRRLLVERYGSLDLLPFVRFLHLDTDSTSNAKEQFDLRADDDPLFPKVRFSPAERVDLTIEGGTGKYVENINTYPHIKRWFQTDGKIAKLGNLGEGAGQVRSASRLGFYHAPNFGNLSSHLDRAQSALKDAANAERATALGFELDPNTINVFVAASLAGGTGAGVFLDMGFLLQKYFPNADRMALLMLPNFFRDYAGGGRARANGYAALTELNHYAFGSGFEANWDGTNAERLPPPPYTMTYLIDSTNEADLVIGSSGKEYDIYRMCAEFLFHDFSISSFAGLKRATRINLVNFNMNVYTHNFLNEALSGSSGTARNVVGDTFPTRFGSFGLSTISFPTDRVHNACASRLARTILESWERDQIEDPLERLFADFLTRPEIRFVQGRYERRDGAGVIQGADVEDALLWYDQASGRTFPGQIWDRVQTLRGEVEAAPRGEKEVVLARGLKQLELQLTREDGHRDEWGVWVRTIDENMRRYLDGLKLGIRARSEEIANDRRHGVVQALLLLRELKAILRNETYQYLGHFSEAAQQWEKQIRHYSREVQRLQSDVARHDRQRLLPAFALRRALDLLAPKDQEGDDLGALYNYFYAMVMKHVVKRGLRVCQEIDDLLGKDDPTGTGLIAQYYNLLQNFQDLKVRLQRKERYFTKPERSELTISLYRDGDVDAWYRTWVGPASHEAEVVQGVGNQILADVFGVATVPKALRYLETIPPDQAEDRMVGNCKRYFESREEQPEALQLLLDTDRFSSAEQEEKIALAYRLAKVWAKKAERGLYHISLRPMLADQRPCLIGLDETDTRRSKQFEQLVRKNIQRAGDSPPSFEGIGDANRGMIVFYNELAGIPAFYPSSVMARQGLKEAYESYQEKDELHIDKNHFQFGDLVPKQADEARRYADSLKAFVLGRLLGILRVKELPSPGSEEPILSYSYKRSTRLAVEEVHLGEESRAIGRLYRDVREPHETDRRKLLDEVESVIHRLRVKCHLEVYALLLDFYMQFVYPKAEDHLRTKHHDITFVKYPPNYAVLALARDQLSRMLSDEAEAAQLRVALEKLRGRSLDQELTYNEYARALESWTRSAGRVLVRREGRISSQRPSYWTVLAVDLKKIDKSADHQRGRPSISQVDAPQRLCPNCGEAIHTRVIYCRHCNKTIAGYLTCPHCGEHEVPNDLEACWRCGERLPPALARLEAEAREMIFEELYTEAWQRLAEVFRLDPQREGDLRSEFGFLERLALGAKNERGYTGALYMRRLWTVIAAGNRFPIVVRKKETRADQAVEHEPEAVAWATVPEVVQPVESVVRPERKGKSLEQAVLNLFAQFFSLEPTASDAVLRKLRRQRPGTQYGHDVSFEAAVHGEPDVRCHIECKNLARDLTPADITHKIAQAAMCWQDCRLDHWIVINPRHGASNDLERLLTYWSDTQQHPFSIQLWGVEERVDLFFGLDPHIYALFFDREPNGWPHPRDWTEEDRSRAAALWRARLRPPLRLPPGWSDYLADPHRLCGVRENVGEMDLIYHTHIPLRCEDEARNPLPRTLETHVRDWLGDPASPILVLLGDFGDGKTAFTYILSRSLAEECRARPAAGWIPLRLQLREFRLCNRNPKTFLQRRLEEIGVDLASWMQLRSRFRPLIILDGFDEMSRSLDAASVTSNIQDLISCAAEFEGLKLLITSRAQFFDNKRDQQRLLQRLGSPQRLRISPIPKQETLRHLEGVAQEIGASNKLSRLQSLYDPIGLAQKPLFLQMIKDTLEYLPDETFDSISLYNTYVDLSLRRKIEGLEDDQLSSLPADLIENLCSILEWVAVELHVAPVDYVSLAEFQGSGGRDLAQLLWNIAAEEGISEDATARVGVRSLLVPAAASAHQSDRWPVDFFHRSMREFFLARSICTLLSSDVKRAVEVLRGAVLTWEVVEFCGHLIARTASSTIEANLLKIIRAGGGDGSSGGNGLTLLNRLVQLQGRRLPSTDWRRMILDHAQLSGADLTGFDFEESSLREANLDNAILEEANFRNADLRGVRIEETTPVEALSLTPAGDRIFAAYDDGSIREWPLPPNLGAPSRLVAKTLGGKVETLIALSGDELVAVAERQIVHLERGASESFSVVSRFALQDECSWVLPQHDTLLVGVASASELEEVHAIDLASMSAEPAIPVSVYSHCRYLRRQAALIVVDDSGASVLDSEHSVRLPIETKDASALSVVEDERRLLVSCGFRDGRVRVWRLSPELTQPEVVFDTKLHEGVVTDVAVLTSGILISGSYDRVIHVVSLDTAAGAKQRMAHFQLTAKCRGLRYEGVQGPEEYQMLERLVHAVPL